MSDLDTNAVSAPPAAASPGPARAPRPRSRWRRLLVPTVVVSIVYFGMLIWPVVHLGGLLAPGWRPGTAEWLAIVLLPIAGRLAWEVRPSRAARMLSAISMTWLGICFQLFALTVPMLIVAPMLGLPDRVHGLLLASLIGAVALAGLIGAQRLVVVRNRVGDARAAAGLRLVQISDVHVGSRFGGFLDRVVDRVLHLAPDHVMITGDLVDFADIGEGELASLARLPMPVWFAIGNHERYVDVDAICTRLTRLGVRVLRDRDAREGPLQVIGIDDADDRRQVAKHLPTFTPHPDAFRVLLYHRPDGLEDAAAHGIDLVLCGHTHNGQIVPFNFLVRRVFPRIRGEYVSGNTRMYVSMGTGTWGPVLRLGSRCEITVHELAA